MHLYLETGGFGNRNNAQGATGARPFNLAMPGRHTEHHQPCSMACGRKRRTGGRGQQAAQNKRHGDTFGTKLKAINFYRQTKNMEEVLARLFSHQGATQQETKRKLIHRWETEREHIEAMCMTVEGDRQKLARR
jgi:hypothetical protein